MSESDVSMPVGQQPMAADKQDRSRARRLAELALPDTPAASFANPGAVMERLKAFAEPQVRVVEGKLGAIRVAPWPPITGCLVVLCTSRSGSTCLARELECVFKIGRLRESLRVGRLNGEAAGRIVENHGDPWFSFKAGGRSVIAAELCGFFDAYLPRTSFILLLRRDIVAQAISGVKARQTGQWHSTQESTKAAVYDRAKIAQSISIIASGVEGLRLYAQRSERPWRPLVYEDFADGDFTSAMAVCDALGIPRRGADSSIRPEPVERIGDAVNDEWIHRFREEMDSATRERIERYLAAI